MYCSKEFIQDIYRTLVQDSEFVDMLQSVWQIELSENMLHLYHMYVICRQPLVRTDSGYHVPSTEEVIAGIRAYFDLSLHGPSAVSADRYSPGIRAYILSMLQGTLGTAATLASLVSDPDNNQGFLLDGVRAYLFLLSVPHGPTAEPSDGADTAALSEAYNAISKVSTVRNLANMLVAASSTRLECVLMTCICVHKCLENPAAGPACECPFVYFFVKFCLDRSWGVPKLALALYERMNMQLSREFIRCANPTCELNKLDKSTGKVKFKLCSRCKTVIYCSHECQAAHYPEHKRLCRKQSTG